MRWTPQMKVCPPPLWPPPKKNKDSVTSLSRAKIALWNDPLVLQLYYMYHSRRRLITKELKSLSLRRIFTSRCLSTFRHSDKGNGNVARKISRCLPWVSTRSIHSKENQETVCQNKKYSRSLVRPKFQNWCGDACVFFVCLLFFFFFFLRPCFYLMDYFNTVLKRYRIKRHS